MADKKLSSVSPVSDMNYVYAETASGETVKISKADLASVVAGIIGTANQNKNGLMPANLTPVGKDSGETLDFNACRDLGRLYCSYRSTNGPIAGAYYWGVFNIGYAGGWFVQIACGSFTDGIMRMYRRMWHSNTTWTSWEKF